MRTQSKIIFFTIYMLLGTAALISVRGQEPALRRPTNPRGGDGAGLDVVVPRGKPAAISDWALAGVVWSDACLLRKLATEAGTEAENEEMAASYAAIARRADSLIEALEDFGWRRISQQRSVKPPASQRGLADRAERNNASARTRRPRDVGGATLVPTDGPIEMDLDQRNFRLEGAGDAEPEILPPQVEKGFEEAIADSGLRPAEFTDERGRISYRESQTKSNTMPYSYESIYDTDDYDPDVDFRNERPLVVADPVPESEIDRRPSAEREASNDNVADMYGYDDPRDPSGDDLDLESTPAKPSNLLDRLSGATQLQQYSSDAGRYKADADWVQLHLNLNQLLWLNAAKAGAIPETITLARMKLKTTLDIAKSSTDNVRLKQVLSR